MQRNTRSIARRIAVWSLVYAANLSVPILYGLPGQDGGNPKAIGAWCAAWVLWAAGCVFVAWSSRLSAAISCGSPLTAVAQFSPEFVEAVGDPVVIVLQELEYAVHGTHRLEPLARGAWTFAQVLAYGQVVGVFAMIAGYPTSWLIRFARHRRSQRVNAINEPTLATVSGLAAAAKSFPDVVKPGAEPAAAPAPTGTPP